MTGHDRFLNVFQYLIARISSGGSRIQPCSHLTSAPSRSNLFNFYSIFGKNIAKLAMPQEICVLFYMEYFQKIDHTLHTLAGAASSRHNFLLFNAVFRKTLLKNRLPSLPIWDWRPSLGNPGSASDIDFDVHSEISWICPSQCHLSLWTENDRVLTFFIKNRFKYI